MNKVKIAMATAAVTFPLWVHVAAALASYGTG